MNDLDLYNLQQHLRTPKIMTFEERELTSNFIYENDSYIVDDTQKQKQKLYYRLMQLGFIDYLEEGNVLKPKKKRFEFFQDQYANIRSIQLKNLSMQENLSNSDSLYLKIKMI